MNKFEFTNTTDIFDFVDRIAAIKMQASNNYPSRKTILIDDEWYVVSEMDFANICQNILEPYGFDFAVFDKRENINLFKIPSGWIHMSWDNGTYHMVVRKKYFSKIEYKDFEPDNYNCITEWTSGDFDKEPELVEEYVSKSKRLFDKYKLWISKKFNGCASSILDLHFQAVEDIIKIHQLEDFKDLLENIHKVIFKVTTNIPVNKGYLEILKDIEWFYKDSRKVIKEICDFELPKITIYKPIIRPQGAIINLRTLYKEWLIRKGYKRDSTVDQYVYYIDRIVERENIFEWNHLPAYIGKLLIRYEKGGKEEDFGNLGHRTPINALGRLYDYLIEINHFTI